jgi:hypothetical protein
VSPDALGGIVQAGGCDRQPASLLHLLATEKDFARVASYRPNRHDGAPLFRLSSIAAVSRTTAVFIEPGLAEAARKEFP